MPAPSSSRKARSVGTTDTTCTPSSAIRRQKVVVWKRRSSTLLAPTESGVTSVTTRPFTWWIGSTHCRRDAASKPCQRAMQSASTSRFCCVSSTPFGAPVVPLV